MADKASGFLPCFVNTVESRVYKGKTYRTVWLRQDSPRGEVFDVRLPDEVTAPPVGERLWAQLDFRAFKQGEGAVLSITLTEWESQSE